MSIKIDCLNRSGIATLSSLGKKIRSFCKAPVAPYLSLHGQPTDYSTILVSHCLFYKNNACDQYTEITSYSLSFLLVRNLSGGWTRDKRE